jgi:hypothetical protein
MGKRAARRRDDPRETPSRDSAVGRAAGFCFQPCVLGLPIPGPVGLPPSGRGARLGTCAAALLVLALRRFPPIGIVPAGSRGKRSLGNGKFGSRLPRPHGPRLITGGRFIPRAKTRHAGGLDLARISRPRHGPRPAESGTRASAVSTRPRRPAPDWRGGAGAAGATLPPVPPAASAPARVGAAFAFRLLHGRGEPAPCDLSGAAPRPRVMAPPPAPAPARPAAPPPPGARRRSAPLACRGLFPGELQRDLYRVRHVEQGRGGGFFVDTAAAGATMPVPRRCRGMGIRAAWRDP